MPYTAFPGSWSLSAGETSVTASVTSAGEYSYFSWSLRDSSNNVLQSRGYSTSTSVTFSGLTPGTQYIVYLSWSHSTTGEGYYDYDSITTLKYWYLRLVLYGNGGKTPSGLTTYAYEGRKQSGTDNLVDVVYDGTVFSRSGYTLKGFNASETGTTIDAPPKGTFSLYSSSNDSSNPTKVNLYAVWEEDNVRPSDWSWSSTVRQRATVTTTKVADGEWEAAYLTASEWNGFLNRIVAFMEYKGFTVSTSPSYVTAGSAMLASQVNAAIQMIDLMSPPTPTPAEVSSGENITAALINGLKNSLNSIA